MVVTYICYLVLDFEYGDIVSCPPEGYCGRQTSGCPADNEEPNFQEGLYRTFLHVFCLARASASYFKVYAKARPTRTREPGCRMVVVAVKKGLGCTGCCKYSDGEEEMSGARKTQPPTINFGNP